jgi:hypothetical protein
LLAPPATVPGRRATARRRGAGAAAPRWTCCARRCAARGP